MKEIEVKKYEAGKSTFQVILENNVQDVESSNTNVFTVSMSSSEGSNIATVTPNKNVKENGATYKANIICTLKKTNEVTDTSNPKGFIQVSLTPRENGQDKILTGSYTNIRLEAKDYLSKTTSKDNLDALVTKKALVQNLREFADQLNSSKTTFNVTYDLAGGNWKDGERANTFYVSDKTFTVNNVERFGYVFNGWKTTKGDKVVYEGKTGDDSTVCLVGTEGHIKATAKWIAKNYKLVYSSNGQVSCTYDTPTTIGNTISAVVKHGYKPSGRWYFTDDGGNNIFLNSNENTDNLYKKLEGLSTLENNATLKIQPEYTPNVYELDYNDCEDLNENDKLNYTFGEVLTLPIPTKAGHKFLGWKLGKNESLSPTTFTLSEADFTKQITDGSYSNNKIPIYAKWEQLKFSISYDLNGGIANGQVNPTLTKPNETITLLDKNSLKRKGYNLIGWDIIDDDTNKGTISEDGFKYTSPSTLDHDVHLRAKWDAENGRFTILIIGKAAEATPAMEVGEGPLKYISISRYKAGSIRDPKSIKVGDSISYDTEWRVNGETAILDGFPTDVKVSSPLFTSMIVAADGASIFPVYTLLNTGLLNYSISHVWNDNGQNIEESMNTNGQAYLNEVIKLSPISEFGSPSANYYKVDRFLPLTKDDKIFEIRYNKADNITSQIKERSGVLQGVDPTKVFKAGFNISPIKTFYNGEEKITINPSSFNISTTSSNGSKNFIKGELYPVYSYSLSQDNIKIESSKTRRLKSSQDYELLVESKNIQIAGTTVTFNGEDSKDVPISPKGAFGPVLYLPLSGQMGDTSVGGKSWTEISKGEISVKKDEDRYDTSIIYQKKGDLLLRKEDLKNMKCIDTGNKPFELKIKLNNASFVFENNGKNIPRWKIERVSDSINFKYNYPNFGEKLLKGTIGATWEGTSGQVSSAYFNSVTNLNNHIDLVGLPNKIAFEVDYYKDNTHQHCYVVYPVDRYNVDMDSNGKTYSVTLNNAGLGAPSITTSF